jgi:F-box protein, helicase, 18
MERTRALTEEQMAIINSTGDIRINAVAGSGKTTTIIEYAATRPSGSRILYLAFNKSVRLEAARKFEERGLGHVKIETAHSLAYKHIVFNHGYTIKAQGYKTHEIVDLLDLRGNGEKHTEYIIAGHISKFLTYFCNSDKAKVQDLNYLDTVSDTKAKAFVKSFYGSIEEGTRLLLAKMDKGEIDIIHDFYLKKFQLSAPSLPYDYILFDEGQDASGAMLDVFLKQRATKVIVGDMHQQIYAWRHAVNSLAKTDFTTFRLSASFRFPQDIALLASGILSWKNHLYDQEPVSISGKGVDTSEGSKATIARTNLGLLVKAIEYITDNRKVKHIYFEGNINSYTYADDGASLYDVLSLYNNSHDRIRDKLVKSMKDIDELEEYIEKTEDVQLSMMVELVKEYGNEIYGIIKSLKDLHTGDEDRVKAEMIFSTVHRAKGMEYDTVFLVGDFITEEKLAKSKDKADALNMAKLNEEINLLYVAVTRTRYQLYIPEGMLPAGFAGAPYIHVQGGKEETKAIGGSHRSPAPRSPAYSSSSSAHSSSSSAHPSSRSAPSFLAARRAAKNGEKTYPASGKDAYQPWTPDLDKALRKMAETRAPIGKIAEHFGRTKGAIYARLKKLGYFSE